MSGEYVRGGKVFPRISIDPTANFQIAVQNRFRSQSYGQRHTSWGKRITKSNEINRERILPSKYVSKYELNDFLKSTNDQIARISSNQVSNITTNNLQLEKNRKLIDGNITLADVYSLASHVANKINLSKQKANLESIRGFRLPSTRYGGEEYYSRKRSFIRNPIRLTDILPKNVRFHQQRQNTSFEFKSSQPNPDVNNQNIDSIDILNKTMKETLLIRPTPSAIN